MSELLWWEFICIVGPVYALGVLVGWAARKAKHTKKDRGRRG